MTYEIPRAKTVVLPDGVAICVIERAARLTVIRGPSGTTTCLWFHSSGHWCPGPAPPKTIDDLKP